MIYEISHLKTSTLGLLTLQTDTVLSAAEEGFTCQRSVDYFDDDNFTCRSDTLKICGPHQRRSFIAVFVL